MSNEQTDLPLYHCPGCGFLQVPEPVCECGHINNFVLKAKLEALDARAEADLVARVEKIEERIAQLSGFKGLAWPIGEESNG